MFMNWRELLGSLKRSYTRLETSHPKMLEAYRGLAAAQGANEVLDPKTRELISLAVAVTTRCDGCIASHAAAAAKAGATKEELADALGVAIAMNAGAAYVYSLRALEAFDELKAA
jgi:AhpD family alkylhydroperoxidase